MVNAPGLCVDLRQSKRSTTALQKASVVIAEKQRRQLSFAEFSCRKQIIHAKEVFTTSEDNTPDRLIHEKTCSPTISAAKYIL